MCRRCLGFYVGTLLSVLVALASWLTKGLPELTVKWACVLLGLGLVLTLPVAITGAIRRRGAKAGSWDGPGFLVLSGFLVGIAAFVCFWGLHSLLF